MTIDRYDPRTAPDPEAWLALDEAIRIELVEAWHEAAGARAENPHAHAVMHVVVENQVAESDKIPVAQRLRQMMAQGLTRHQAIHAIASVAAKHIFSVMRSGAGDEQANARYYAALKRLDSRKWARSG